MEVPLLQPPGGKRQTPTIGPTLRATGNVQNLVLMLRFSDHGPGGQNRTLPSQSDVDLIMNAVGGDPTLAPTGSVRDHYLENSYGQLTIDSTAHGWLDMPNTEAALRLGRREAEAIAKANLGDAADNPPPLTS